jgi:hypothetical protein
VNGAIESGSGSIPSAIWIIVTLPVTDDLVDLAGRRRLLAHLLRELVERLVRAALAEPERVGSSIVAETREMTSAPKGCCLFSCDCTASGEPVSRSSRFATTVVVPRSNAIANVARSCRPARRRAARSSQRTAVTLKSGVRERAAERRAGHREARASSTSSIAASTRSKSEA